ncbi:MAG: multiheme c-type cytochrome [Planctomycetota bacterium]
MNRCLVKGRLTVVGACYFIALIVGGQLAFPEGKPAGYELGQTHYENNETDKATEVFKNALSVSFAEPASGKLQRAISLTKSGKTEEATDILLTLLDDEATAARARYELGLIYENQGKLDEAATMFRNAAIVIADKGAAYAGVKACKMCHLKQYKTWKTTKMAKTFEVLKPGVRAEAKAKLKFDPQKDYTKDVKCLECHTTGFGMPGGYKIPKAGDSKAAKRAKENSGTTCEACHGPGSKYKAIHKEVMRKKRKYTLEELYQVGQYRVDVKTCTTCHNRRNPTNGSDYHFDYEKYKAEDTHENFPLKYQAKE